MKINLAAFLGPKDAAAFLARGSAWALKGEYDKAIQDYDEAIRLEPNRGDAFNNRGDAWDAKQEYDKAIRDFDEAIRLDPNDDDAFLNRSIARHAKGEYDKAIQDFNQAIRLNPELAVVLSAVDVANIARPKWSAPPGRGPRGFPGLGPAGTGDISNMTGNYRT
jgi:tetratricopeptide (TPR) repeat protein